MTTMPTDPQALRAFLESDLIATLQDVTEHYLAMRKPVERFNTLPHVDYEDQLRLTPPSVLIDNVYSNWLSSMLEQCAHAWDAPPNVEISKNTLTRRHTQLLSERPDLDQLLDQYSIPDGFIGRVAATFPFTTLADEMTTLGQELTAEGFKKAANDLAMGLYLIASNYFSDETPKQTRRHWTFPFRIYIDTYGNSCSYSFGNRQSLSDLATSLRVAQREAGLSDLAAGVDMIRNSIYDTNHSLLPTRTLLASDYPPLSALVYKHKLVLQMSHNDGDGLLAFIAAHTDKTLRSLD